MNTQPTTTPGIFLLREGKKTWYATQNLTPGKSVTKEKITILNGTEYRILDPRTTKLGAALHKGISALPLKPTDALLYLGASSGTTVSYFSDILKNGCIFAIEHARLMCTQLVFLAQERPNIAPILADAAQPTLYAPNLCQVDVLYQDISQRNQVDIFLANAALFLKPGGIAILCLKARSIDIRQKPQTLFVAAETQITKHFTIIDKKPLEPYQKDHLFLVCKFVRPF